MALFAELSECNLDNTPAESLNQLTQLAQQAWNGFQAIQTFSVAQYASNPVAQRDQLVAQILDQWHAYYTHIAPHIAYSKGRSTDYAALEREARGTLSLMKDLVTTLTTEKDKGVAEIQGALAKVRQAAAEAGVAWRSTQYISARNLAASRARRDSG